MNKYEVLGIVGEGTTYVGAYGVVLKAKHKETGNFVAIKKFKENEDEALHKVSLREVKLLRQLKHDHIVQLIEAFRRKSKLYLVFEFVDRNLLEVLEECPYGVSVRTRQAVQTKHFVFQLLKAIEHCHKQQVIHRDIKPENLLVSNDQKLKVCDFGFARVISKSGDMTDYVATRWYRAPELLLGECYGAAVDLWSVGCIMGELTNGKPLFPGNSEIDQLHVIQKVLGPLPQTQAELFMRNPKFSGIKFAEGRSETLDKQFLGKLKKSGISLMKRLLEYSPEDRISAEDALKHPYFDDFRGVSVEKPPRSVLQRSESCSNRRKALIFAGHVYVRRKLLQESRNSNIGQGTFVKEVAHSSSPSKASMDDIRLTRQLTTDPERSNSRVEHELPATSKATERMPKQKVREDSSWMVKLPDFHEAFSEVRSNPIKLKRKIKNDLLLKQFSEEDAKKPSPQLRPTLAGRRRQGASEITWDGIEVTRRGFPAPSSRMYAGRLFKHADEVLADSTNSSRQLPHIFQ
jgi:cyclin-dependent kinase-like